MVDAEGRERIVGKVDTYASAIQQRVRKWADEQAGS